MLSPSLEIKLNSPVVDFGLKAWHLAAIKAVLAAYPEVEDFGIFGSRAKGSHSYSSDIDLVLFGSRISYDTFLQITDDLYTLPLVYTFDVVRFDSLRNEQFRDRIMSEWRPLPKDTFGPSRPSATLCSKLVTP